MHNSEATLLILGFAPVTFELQAQCPNPVNHITLKAINSIILESQSGEGCGEMEGGSCPMSRDAVSWLGSTLHLHVLIVLPAAFCSGALVFLGLR